MSIRTILLSAGGLVGAGAIAGGVHACRQVDSAPRDPALESAPGQGELFAPIVGGFLILIGMTLLVVIGAYLATRPRPPAAGRGGGAEG
jgi:hypothetical protein